MTTSCNQVTVVQTAVGSFILYEVEAVGLDYFWRLSQLSSAG